MTWTTPAPTEIPYAEDGDPRALLPATMEAQSARLHELLASYTGSGVKLGGAATAAPATIDFGWSADPGTPMSYAGGIITWTGPNRLLMVTLAVTVSAGSALRSSAGIGTAAGVSDRLSELAGGVGPDGSAIHTHTVQLVAMFGPDYVTTIAANVAGEISPAAAVPFDARIDVVAL